MQLLCLCLAFKFLSFFYKQLWSLRTADRGISSILCNVLSDNIIQNILAPAQPKRPLNPAKAKRKQKKKKKEFIKSGEVGETENSRKGGT